MVGAEGKGVGVVKLDGDFFGFSFSDSFFGYKTFKAIASVGLKRFLRK